MTFVSPTSRCFPRVATAAAMTLVVAMAGSGVAWAAGGGGSAAGGGNAGGGPSGSEASLQIQAQELAGRIQANGVQLDQLDGAYNAAELQYQQLGSQEAQLEKMMAQTARTAAAAKQELKNQALLDYITGGAPLITHIPVLPSNPNLATSYAEIIAGSQERSIQVYHQVMLDQARQEKQLGSAEQQAAVTLMAIENDRAAATRTLADQQATLDQVKGKLAVAVAQVQAQQQKAEQAAVETSLSQQGQLPPGSPGTASSGAGSTTVSNPASPVATEPIATGQPVTPPSTTVPAPTTDPASPPAPAPPTTAPVGVPAPSGNSPAPGYQLAIAYARAQIGKPYAWGGAGPNSFDCSGLVMMAWAQAGVYFPHLAQDQYDMTERIPLASLLPGDLVFYGTPSDVYHVGLYIGGGDMIAAPETGENVQIQSIYWSGLLGGGRVRS